MKRILMAASILLLTTGHGALAAEGTSSKPQTTRMSQCSATAKEKGLKGDARKEHMSMCLRGPGAQTAAKE